MPIRSTFYDTTPGEGVKETSWAQSAQSRGALYGVVGATDLALTPHATTPYAVNLSPGKFWAHGVWDESTGASLVQSVAPANGAVRWDLIAARRDWQPTGGGPTSFVSIQGGTTVAIPASREKRPGIVDDQPLYLVKWKGGQTQPEQIIDLRCWASNGGVEVVDKLALSYLEAPGAEVKLGADVWRYESKGNGVWGWGVTPRVAFTAEGYTLSNPILKTGTLAINADENGAAAIRFGASFPNRILGLTLTQATAPNLGLIHAVYDEALSNNSRAAVFLYDRSGERLRNVINVRVSFMAWGE